jgi:porin
MTQAGEKGAASQSISLAVEEEIKMGSRELRKQKTEMVRRFLLSFACATRRGASCLAGFAALMTVALPSRGIAKEATNAAPSGILLISPLGQPVNVSTNVLPAALLPPPGVGLKSQVPTPARGSSTPGPVLQRQAEAREGREAFRFFPPYQPKLAPYLAAQDALGNTAVKPGPLLPSSSLDTVAQQGKYWLSEAGLTYSLQQTLTWVSMTDVMQGANNLGYYTFSWQSKWAVFDAPSAGAAGWLSTKINAKTGLGAAGDTQSAGRNLGSATDPTGIWSGVNGFRIPELAWQQSFRDGQVVVVAGMVDQSNYLDANSYANSGRGQFLNSALINSMVVPLTAYNFGLNLQWQPADEWYGMLGSSAGYGHARVVPWTDFAWDNWTLVAELGYAPRDFLGLGPGVYRVQPFVGQVQGDPAQAGFGLNFQQQLGQQSPFGWFGRYGRGGSERFQGEATRADTGTQVGTGIIMRGPLEYAGVFPSRRHDAAGIGFVWSHPTSEDQPLHHQDEFGVELGYVLQLTPTMKLQPDLQVVWNRAHNPDSGPAIVLQLQLDLAW